MRKTIKYHGFSDDIPPALSCVEFWFILLNTATCFTVVPLLLIAPATRQGAQDIPLGFPRYRGELSGNITGSTGVEDALYAKVLVFKQGEVQEGGNSVILCASGGVEQMIPRNNIKIVRPMATSLMPDGLEEI